MPVRPALRASGIEPALDQILLVDGQIEAGTLLQQFTQILVLQRRHERTPANNWINFGAI